MPGKIKTTKQAMQILEIANTVYKLMGASGHIRGIKAGPRLYNCTYSIDAPGRIDFGKLNFGGNLAKFGNQELVLELPKQEQGVVELKKLLLSQKFKKTKNTLPIVFGVNTLGKPIVMDLVKMPHILLGGQAGSGKSTFLKTVYESLTRKMKSAALKFIVIDSKNVDFKQYRGSEYLLKPVVTSASGGIRTLAELVDIMNKRYQMLKSAGVKNIAEYQKKHKDMPYIVLLVDELSDLMSQNHRAVEGYIQSLAQKSRAVGIHMIIATRALSRNNLSNIVRANMPTVIVFKTRDKNGSVLMLGESGAENLLNYGDVLFSDAGRIPVRLHTPYIR